LAFLVIFILHFNMVHWSMCVASGGMDTMALQIILRHWSSGAAEEFGILDGLGSDLGGGRGGFISIPGSFSAKCHVNHGSILEFQLVLTLAF
jgi:hypothetical protein